MWSLATNSKTFIVINVLIILYYCVFYVIIGKEFGADDFLPALSYVIVQCNLPELLIEVEYMMELLDTPWLTGEGMKHLCLFFVFSS